MSVFSHQFKRKWDKSTLDYRNDWLWTAWFQVVGEVIEGNRFKPRDTLSCSWSCWAFLRSDLSAGSSLCRARTEAHAKCKYCKRLGGRYKGMYCGIQHKTLMMSGQCLMWQMFVAHGPCGCEVPQLLQEEKKELLCVWGWSTQSLPGTGRSSAGRLQESQGLSGKHGAAGAASPSTALSQLSSHCSQRPPAPSRHGWATAAADRKKYCNVQMVYHATSLLPADKHRLSIRKPLKIYITH